MNVEAITVPVGNDCWFPSGNVEVFCQGDATAWDWVTPGDSVIPLFCSFPPDPQCINNFPQHGQTVGSITCEGDEWVASAVQLHADFPFGVLITPPCSQTSLELEWRQPLQPGQACPPSDEWNLTFARLGNAGGGSYETGINARLIVN